MIVPRFCTERFIFYLIRKGDAVVFSSLADIVHDSGRIIIRGDKCIISERMLMLDSLRLEFMISEIITPEDFILEHNNKSFDWFDCEKRIRYM